MRLRETRVQKGDRKTLGTCSRNQTETESTFRWFATGEQRRKDAWRDNWQRLSTWQIWEPDWQAQGHSEPDSSVEARLEP
jgi:hypothetical protein